MGHFLPDLLNAAIVLFAASSMFSLGLAHNLKEILEPLRNIRGVLRVLIANFVLVPCAAYLITSALSLSRPLEIGLIFTGLAAGAPFLIKLTEHAWHDTAIGATLLVLLLPATVLYMPIVAPILLSEGDVQASAIARPLVMTMLVPMAAGLLLKYLSNRWAGRLVPATSKIATIALAVLILCTIALNLRGILTVIMTGAIWAAVAFILAAFAIGYLMGGRDQETRGVVGLATAQRNVAAATVVVTQGIDHPGALVMVVVTSLVGLAVLFPMARILRHRLLNSQDTVDRSGAASASPG